MSNTSRPPDFAVPDWTPRQRPPRAPMAGQFVDVVPFDPDIHAEALHRAFCKDRSGTLWAYMPYGPFADAAAYRAFAKEQMSGDDPLFHAIIDKSTGAPSGVASYLRIEPAHGVVEVGHICFSPALQRTAAATEAMFLLARRVFDELGYRRYEWKCNALNMASKRAATRFGFRYEGTFRQHLVVKGRNRDTAWFSMLDNEWPARRHAYQRWLSAANFDAAGQQIVSLADLIADA